MYCNASGLAEHITFYSNFKIDLRNYNFDYGCQGIQVHAEHVLCLGSKPFLLTICI